MAWFHAGRVGDDDNGDDVTGMLRLTLRRAEGAGISHRALTLGELE